MTNPSDFVGKRYKAAPDAGDLVLGYDPNTNDGVFVTPAVDPSQFAPLDSPTLVGPVTIENADTSVKTIDVFSNTGHATGNVSRFSIENNVSQELVDINFRFCQVNIGSTSAASGGDGCALQLVRPAADSSNPIRIYKPGSNTIAAAYFGPNGSLVMNNTDLSSNAFVLRDSNAANIVLIINNAGRLAWGNASDTILERKAADVLGMGTGDAFRLGSTTTAARPAAGTAGAGALMYDTDLGKIIMSTGAAWQAVTST